MIPGGFQIRFGAGCHEEGKSDKMVRTNPANPLSPDAIGAGVAARLSRLMSAFKWQGVRWYAEHELPHH